MERDGQFAGAEHAQHLDPNETLRNENGVPPVDRYRVDRLKPCQGTTFRRQISARAPHVDHRAAGLHAAKNVTSCQVLVLDGDPGRAIDPSVLESLEGTCRKREAMERVTGKHRSRFLPSRMDCHSHSLNQDALTNRLTKRCPNILFRASGAA